MASQPLVLSDPNLLAEFMRESEFKGLFEKRFAAPPDLAALLFRNGQLIDSFKGAHFSVGGLVNAIKGIAGGSSHISIMLADLKPFPVKLAVRGLSRDNVEVTGVATLELQLDPDKPSNILGLMSGASRQQAKTDPDGNPLPGRKAISRQDVLERIAPHFSDRVVEAVLRRTDAADIRGDAGIQDKIQADMMKEAERVCGDLGLMVRAVSVEWAMNAVEREAFERAQIDRQQEALDYQLDLLKRQVERQSESTVFQLDASTNLTKLQAASEDELAHMVLQSEVRFIDAREEAQRRQELEALAHEIEVLRTERAAKMENEIADAGHLINLTSEAARLRKTEREIEELDARHAQNLKKMGVLSDLELRERSQRMELELARLAQEQAAKNLQRMMEAEKFKADSDNERDIRRQKAESDSEIARMKAEADARTQQLMAGAKMTPEQILAINAGLSPHVAEVLKEQARAQAGSSQESMEIMRELIKGATEERAAGRAHELDILQAGMAGATGVAHGAGGKGGDVPDMPEGSAGATVDCPKCGRKLPAKAIFCGGCGHRMRT
ncbi:hypothetical protein [Hyphomonas sp.]|uniref:hypothetical protein n=1 Tax=Hyphomonas sp. TaxID=87 RepID=UPI00391BEA65